MQVLENSTLMQYLGLYTPRYFLPLYLFSVLKVELFQIPSILSHKGVLKTKRQRINTAGDGSNAFKFFFCKEAFLISTYEHGCSRLSLWLTFLVSQFVAESTSIFFWVKKVAKVVHTNQFIFMVSNYFGESYRLNWAFSSFHSIFEPVLTWLLSTASSLLLHDSSWAETHTLQDNRGKKPLIFIHLVRKDRIYFWMRTLQRDVIIFSQFSPQITQMQKKDSNDKMPLVFRLIFIRFCVDFTLEKFNF